MSSAESETDSGGDSDPYHIRLYEPDDREDFLSLYETVLGDGGSDEWFEWKYVRNPYVDHVSMFVAEHEGTVVGTRPYLAFRVSVGGQTVLGLQTCDTMVHPDHRRKGLFTRMTERSFDYYGSEEEPVLKFSIPNALSRPGYLKLGCEIVSQLPACYRIQRPNSMVGDGKIGRVASAAQPFATVYNAARDRLTAPNVDADVDVVRHESIPVDELVELYESAAPARIHAVRDEAFYQWRFTNPHWEYQAYTARTNGEPVAAVITGTQASDSMTHVQLTEVLPLLGGDRNRDAFAALLKRILRDSSDADMVSASGPTIPRDLLTSFGFHADDSLPLSPITTPTVLITKLLDDREEDRWIFNGYDLLDPSSWHLSYSEHNTS